MMRVRRVPWRPLVGFALALVALGALAQVPRVLPAAEAFRLSARALDDHTLEARFNVADGYYMYREKFVFSVDGGPPLPAKLPKGEIKDDEFFGKVETYRGLMVAPMPLAQAAPGRTVTLKVESQGCADVGVCYPPHVQEIKLTLPAAGAGPTPAVEAGAGKLPWQ